MLDEYNPAFNDYIRIPIQLKFERDDMFETLIAPARADRSLTALIQQLLQAYYTSQTVRDIIAQQSMGFTDIDLLAKQVDKVARAHSNTRMLANMMADDIQDANDGVYASNTANTSGQTTGQSTGTDAVMSMLQEIAAQVGNLSNRMNNLENVQAQQVTVHTTPMQTTPVQHIPVQPTVVPVQPAPVQPVPVQPVPVQTQMQAQARTTVNDATNAAHVQSTNSSGATTNPANSFAKLVTSMAKLG